MKEHCRRMEGQGLGSGSHLRSVGEGASGLVVGWRGSPITWSIEGGLSGIAKNKLFDGWLREAGGGRTGQ